MTPIFYSIASEKASRERGLQMTVCLRIVNAYSTARNLGSGLGEQRLPPTRVLTLLISDRPLVSLHGQGDALAVNLESLSISLGWSLGLDQSGGQSFLLDVVTVSF
jgi:hypothetical protein